MHEDVHELQERLDTVKTGCDDRIRQLEDFRQEHIRLTKNVRNLRAFNESQRLRNESIRARLEVLES